ncbi:GAF domain-like protein [Bisporella sp. PMI_857]|nr:GAF domain-like protein [Bisporella sp. PMI_857]
MVHADSSNFAAGVTKEEAYEQVLSGATALFEGLVGNRYFFIGSHDLPLNSSANSKCSRSNLANAASLLWHAYKSLPSPSSEVNWAGFYVLDPSKEAQLILGPFQGKVACQTIAFGRGVCGAAAKDKTTQLVPDVEKFPGHIACDSESQSEIVVPVLKDGKTVAIIDIDCALKGGFDEVDKRWLEKLALVLSEGCDWRL